MKNLKFKWLLLSIILSVAGISQVWAVTFNGGKLYFDATNFQTKTAIQFAFIKCGDSPHSDYWGMSNVTNTNLYYVERTTAFGGLWYIAVIGNSSSWGSGDHCANVGNASSYTNTYNADWTFNNGSEYYFYTASNTAGDLVPCNDVPSKTQTVISYLDGSQAANSPARIKIDSYYKSGNGTSCATNSVTTTNRDGSYTSSFDCIITAKTTLKVDDVRSGLTFVGWYETDGTLISSDAEYTYYASSDKTIHARFETQYSVTVTAGSNGTTTPTSGGSVTAGYYTNPEVSATANNGYYFTRWTLPDGVTAASGYSSTSNPIKIKASAASKSITANFAARWVLRGSDMSDGADELPGWSTTTANMTAGSTTTKEVILKPNTRYKYRIYDLKNSTMWGPTGDSDQPFETAWTLSNTDHDAHFTTKGHGTYLFSVTVDGATDKPSVTVSPQFTSYQISMGYQTKSDGAASASPGDGGYISAKDGDNFTVENNSWVKSDGSVTFSATPNNGYQFIGWYSSSTTNGDGGSVEAVSTANPYTISDIEDNISVYALFKEVLFDVIVDNGNGTPSVEQVGIVSHPSITAVKRSGYVFNRWVATGSAVLNDNYANPATINSVSDNQSTIRATYKDLPYIYYDITGAYNNGAGWCPSTMYVYFYNSEYWNNDNGSGYKDRPKHFGRMEKVNQNGTLWRYRYDPDTIGTITNIAFMQHNQNSNEYFYGNEGSYCAYHSCNNMFVITKSGSLAKNTTNYRNDDYTNKYGYWSNYGETTEARTGLASGFYLNNLTGGSYSEEFVDENGDGVFTISANLDGNTDYGFYIGGCGGGNWSNVALTLTATNNSGTFYIYSDGVSGKFAKVSTTVPGYYTFKLTPQIGDGDQPKLTLEVVYPVAANDYRATITRGGKKYTSNIIKSGESSGTISLWLAEGDNTIHYEHSTLDGSGNVTWNDDGNQTVNVAKAGVYTMTLAKTGTTRISDVQAYTGNYYIRTDWAPGGWQDYKENLLIKNSLTYKEGDATTFDYYFCKWISKSGSDANVRFVVANEYNMAISDTLKTDAALDGQEYLPSGYPANVRFSWNSSTNTVKRAYIAGSTNPNDRFLIMRGDTKLFDNEGNAINYSSKYDQLSANETYFSDKNNWVYQVDVQAKSGAQVTLVGKYNGSDRELYGTSTLITSTATDKLYNLTTIYDFKTNNLMTSWKPGNVTIDETLSNIRSVMLVRSHQSGADQIQIGDGSIVSTLVYGVMQFNKYTLNNQNSTGSHESYSPSDPSYKSNFERDLFWISFPFDVNLRDVFGFGEYGKHWIIEYYDGQGRAEHGFWADSPSNWKFVTPAMRNDFELKNGVGYILALDLAELGMGSSVWNNSVTDVALYFPSSTNVTINAEKATVDVPAHKCNIGPRFTNGDDRTIKDSHWNVIGVPSFANVGGLIPPGTIEGKSYPDGLGFYYQWRMSDNTLSVQAAGSEIFKTMHAYMVQFTGTIDWSTPTASIPSSVAARTQTTADRDYKLVLMRESEEEDHTLLRLTDDANVSNRFEFNYDLCKEYNAGRGNIWTVTADTVEVAGNSMPKPLQTTLVPVGVKVVANGEYTLAMPEGTNGEDVYLIDNAYGTRTNLGLMPYTVTLTAGTYDSRFALEFGPIQDAPTGIEQMSTVNYQLSTEEVRKVFVGGRLYIIRDGKVYDAAGQRVE